MRRLFIATSFLWLLWGATSAVQAQGFPNFAYLTGHYDGSALQLEIRILSDGYAGAAVGLDLYRSNFSLLGCDPPVRITDQPIPYPNLPYPVSLQFTDAGVTSGAGYHYEARPVDAQRNPVEGYPISGSATTGPALLAQAKVYFDAYGSPSGYFLLPCPQSCMVDGTLEQPLPDELLPYVDTETPVLLYGEVTGTSSGYNSFFPKMRVDHAEPTTCVIEVAPASWSLVKHLYR